MIVMSTHAFEDRSNVPGEPKSPRARYRDEVRGQIKRRAERQLAEVGPAGLSVSAIARELGLSGPALYRYFPSRDALLSELVADAYGDLADALADAVRHDAGGTTPLERSVSAYRAWALANPHRYRLLYQPPVPGFDPNEPVLVQAAARSMTILLEALGASGPAGSGAAVPTAVAASFSTWAAALDVDASPEAILRGVLIWSRLHGFVSLEIAGNFALMAPDADALFAVEMSQLTR
jgi:AcrR family transcriptional regulator